MTPERYLRIDHLFEATLNTPATARKSLLISACGNDDDLRLSVEVLLAAHDSAESFLSAPAIETLAQSLVDESWRYSLGDHLGRYEILGLLGAGGMGEVYRAMDARLDRQVAIKVLPRHLSEDETALRHFEQEAKAVAALSHPNIVTIFDIGLEDGLPYAVMELLEGETLRDRLARSPLTWAEFAEIGRSIAAGLAAGHAKEIIHKDVKPENIFLTAEGRVKILDFGLARIGATGRSGVWGSPYYRSPEQALGLPVDSRSDIFSAGIVLYEMVTGQTPFGGSSADEIAANIVSSETQPIRNHRADVPREIENIILQCLAKSAGSRLQSADDLCLALKGISQTTRSRPVSSNLRTPLTSLIGRKREMQDILQTLRSSRLVSLVGSAGCGKTRLSTEVGSRALGQYADGVWIVPLASVSDPALVPRAVASILGVRENRSKNLEQTLPSWMASREMLLILDNCEHLLDACSELVEQLLSVAANLNVLVTSREPLGVLGEITWRVPPLPLPVMEAERDSSTGSHFVLWQNDAVALLIDRAKRACPSLTLDEDNVRSLAEICHRVDGIPLAIELAAARLQVLTPRQLKERLADRFKLLTGGSAAEVPHHRALRATIDWSYDLLSRKERILFERLAVFAGGWTLAAAEVVCRSTDLEPSEILDVLSALVKKSLVVTDFQDGAETRFRYLETVREYAGERLREKNDSGSAYSQHAKFFFDFAREAHNALDKGERNPWLERLGRERDNFRSAFAWSSENTHGCLSFAVSLWSFFRLAGHFSEGREYLERALAKESGDASSADRTRAKILTGHCAILQGDYPVALAVFEETLETATRTGDREVLARSHDALCEIGRLTDRYDVAQQHAEESLLLWRTLNNRRRTARSLSDLGEIARLRQDYGRARPLLEEGLAMQRQEGESEDVVQSLIRIGVVAQYQGDYPLARSLVEESLEIGRRLQYQRGIEIATHNLAVISTLQEDYASARAFNEECLQSFRASGDRWGQCSTYISLGAVCRHEGDYESARDILGQGLAIARELGTKRAVGAALNQLGITARLQGDLDAARSVSLEALATFHDLASLDGMAYSFENLATLDMTEGRVERAILLWGFAERLRSECACPLPPGHRLEYDRNVAEARQSAGEESFADLWAQGARLELASAIETASKDRAASTA